MHRRHALQSVAAALTGGLIAPAPRTGASQPASGQPQQRRTAPGFIEAIDGTRLFYRDAGSGPPIVFVAPWALVADWWDDHLVALSRQSFRCIAFDRRGHGRSDEPGRGYDFDTLADDLSAVLTALDLQGVMLVGHSMGAAEVVRYLVRHRAARVTRAVLVAPTTPLTMKTEDNPDGVAHAILQQGRDGLQKDRATRVAQAAAAFFGAPQNVVSADTLGWWTRMIVDRCSLKVLLDLHRVLTETDFRPELPSIRTRTLVVHGDRDASAPLELTGRRTHRLIPGSELKIYEGAAHGLPLTHAARLRDDLVAFARQTPTA